VIWRLLQRIYDRYTPTKHICRYTPTAHLRPLLTINTSVYSKPTVRKFLLTPRHACVQLCNCATCLHVCSPEPPAPPVGPKTTVTLNDGSEFPIVSFGLWVYGDKEATEYTLLAISVGIRNFFASVLARNQKGFGAAVKQSSVPRCVAALVVEALQRAGFPHLHCLPDWISRISRWGVMRDNHENPFGPP
jgi:hypothetical protein